MSEKRKPIDPNIHRNLVILGNIPADASSTHIITTLSTYGNINYISLFSFPHYPKSSTPYPLLNTQQTIYAIANYLQPESQKRANEGNLSFRWDQKVNLVLTSVDQLEIDYVIGMVNNTEDINLEWLEDDPEGIQEPNYPLLRRILCHTHLASLLGQHDIIRQLYAYFFSIYLTMPKIELELDDPKQLVKSLGKKDFSIHNLKRYWDNIPENILKISQNLYWVSVMLNIQTDKKVELIKHFVIYMQHHFAGIKFKGLDEESEKLFYCLWKIKFLNKDYSFIEKNLQLDQERIQHWIVTLISNLQSCYYEIAKCHYFYYEVEGKDLFKYFDSFFLEFKEQKSIEWKKTEQSREIFSVFELFGADKGKQEVIEALIKCTNNLLSHRFYAKHPRRFVVEYVRSLKLILSLKGLKSFSFAGELIEKKNEQLSLSQTFPTIFRNIVLFHSIYQLRKQDLEASTLNLIDFLTFSINNSRDDYDNAVEVKTIKFIFLENQKHGGIH